MGKCPASLGSEGDIVRWRARFNLRRQDKQMRCGELKVVMAPWRLTMAQVDGADAIPLRTCTARVDAFPVEKILKCMYFGKKLRHVTIMSAWHSRWRRR